MNYNPNNVERGTNVFDVEANAKIDRVTSIDTDTGEVECCSEPLQITAFGEIATFKIKFTAIHPIRGGAMLPCLFHCYGRQA